MTTTNKPMTIEQLDELMTVSVNLQRESEKLGDRPAAIFAYAVQVAVLELRSLKTREFPVEFVSIAENIRTQDIRVPMPVLVTKEMVHQLYHTETKRCRNCNDGLRGGYSSCAFYKP